MGSPQRPAAGRGGSIGAGDWTALFGGVAPGTAYSGGAYRQSNADAFDIGGLFETGTTGAVRLSATASYGAWIAGLEYASAHADLLTSFRA